VTGSRNVSPGRKGVTPIRSRRTYDELRRPTGRGRHGPISVRYVEHAEWHRPELAYAVGRNVGNAVERNLLRRRMRAVVSESAGQLPMGAYLVRSEPTGPSLDFDELKVAMSRAIEKATTGARQGSRGSRPTGGTQDR
jgi:ribonuclease P protein component